MIRSIPSGRAMIDKKTVHIHDVMTPESSAEFSDSFRTGDIRTILVTPLLREGIAIGAIHVRRPEVRPFSDKQIALLKTFADQAVIAIENVRLFKELEVRNRDLTEALEQQTATSEILRVIASSPTDIQSVLDTVAECAARLCDSVDAQIWRVEGDMQRKVASYGVVSSVLGVGETRPIRRGSASGRAILDRQIIHIPDITAEREEDYADVRRAVGEAFGGIRTGLAVPLMREGVPIGAITIRRIEVRPFTEKQIALLKTFADQAVILLRTCGYSRNCRIVTTSSPRHCSSRLRQARFSGLSPARRLTCNQSSMRLSVARRDYVTRHSPPCTGSMVRCSHSMLSTA